MDVHFKNMKMKKAKGLHCFLWLLLVNLCDASRLGMANQTPEVNKLLSSLNKTPLKSIMSPDGDIIDCVLVSQQPAFDHPSLKNHSIQMRPSYHPEGLEFDDSKVSTAKSIGKGDNKPITQLWHLNGSCPLGTVPIRRTKEEDVLRASTVESFGKKQHRSFPRPKSANLDQTIGAGHEHAIAYVNGDKYYGAKATINVWAPKVQQRDEFSLSQLWILSGNGVDLNTIEAGWQVFPLLFGDGHTRLFTYWTTDDYQSTGCYNLLCSGFIQINNKISLGATISPLSSYGGSQYDITILVWKDPKVGNWWLQFGNQILGYWPGNMFTYLYDSASEVQWGGEVVNLQSNGHTTTSMGSGHFPEEGSGKASFFRNIQTVDGSNKLRDVDGVGNFAERPTCYRTDKLGKSKTWGSYFYYGGPGKNPSCP